MFEFNVLRKFDYEILNYISKDNNGRYIYEIEQRFEKDEKEIKYHLEKLLKRSYISLVENPPRKRVKPDPRFQISYEITNDGFETLEKHKSKTWSKEDVRDFVLAIISGVIVLILGHLLLGN